MRASAVPLHSDVGLEGATPVAAGTGWNGLPIRRIVNGGEKLFTRCPQAPSLRCGCIRNKKESAAGPPTAPLRAAEGAPARFESDLWAFGGMRGGRTVKLFNHTLAVTATSTYAGTVPLLAVRPNKIRAPHSDRALQ
jgi:hypothetical protein